MRSFVRILTLEDGIGHCILCGKAYKYWKCFGKHYEQEHPECNKPWDGEGLWPMTIRVMEVADAMHEEAKAFLETNINWEDWRVK